MSQWNDYNQTVIEEFRASGGSSGTFVSTVLPGDPSSQAPRPLILLTTIGAKSGKRHTTPLMYRRDGDRLVVFAAKGGAPTNPDWYHNLVANPTVTVEVGTDRFEATASVAKRAERDSLYAAQAKEYPWVGEYQAMTTRQFPAIILARRA